MIHVTRIQLQPMSVILQNLDKINSDKEKLQKCACENYGASPGFAGFLHCKH
jgi:hypothetical protein